jgi:hypothetical protein
MRMRPIVCSSIPFAMMNRRVQESMLKHPQCAQISIAEAPTGLDDLLEDRLRAFARATVAVRRWSPPAGSPFGGTNIAGRPWVHSAVPVHRYICRRLLWVP